MGEAFLPATLNPAGGARLTIMVRGVAMIGIHKTTQQQTTLKAGESSRDHTFRRGFGNGLVMPGK
jgi:hypothetical protein